MNSITKDAIERIRSAGFSHIKVELEGQMGRQDDNSTTCPDCEGEYNITCEQCDGEGAYSEMEQVGVNEREQWHECGDCDGEGTVPCSNCDGEGTISSDWDNEDDCHWFILQNVSQHARDVLTYSRFYLDGSVDSEITFTIPIGEIAVVPEFIEAFKKLADLNQGLDTRGAGMHIAVIPSEMNGRYPSHHRMPSNRCENFRTQMSMLLPALYFLGSADHNCRGLGYRKPQIRYNDKYSAIYTHDDTCFEYRVFETCYNKPEIFFDYVEVIANTLKFYTDPTLTVAQLGKQFGLCEGTTVERMYNTPEQLRILNSTVKYLKPKKKSLKKLKEERGVFHTIKSLTATTKSKRLALQKEWRENDKRIKQVIKSPLTENEKARVDRHVLYDGLTPEQAIKYVRGVNTDTMKQEDFINRNLTTRRWSSLVAV